MLCSGRSSRRTAKIGPGDAKCYDSYARSAFSETGVAKRQHSNTFTDTQLVHGLRRHSDRDESRSNHFLLFYSLEKGKTVFREGWDIDEMIIEDVSVDEVVRARR